MLKVDVQKGNIEKALKILKKKVRNTKQNQELRDRKQHTKKSVKKRKQKLKAIYIEQKRTQEED